MVDADRYTGRRKRKGERRERKREIDREKKKRKEEEGVLEMMTRADGRKREEEGQPEECSEWMESG